MNLLVSLALASFVLAFSGTATASPGAHGPNGEHLDGPATMAVEASAQPRLQTHSELFEIVGRLDDGRFSFFINRYDSNEPVLGAKVEIELGPLKATAAFHKDAGDYSVNDPALLATLAQPGQHALLFTVSTGAATDLLEGQLPVIAASAAPSSAALAGWPKPAWLALGALVAAALTYPVLRRRHDSGVQSAGASR